MQKHTEPQRTFFSEIISTISDIKFSRCGRYMLSRDYMTVKLWDIHRDDKPVSTYNVQEPLRGKVRSGIRCISDTCIITTAVRSV